MTFLISDIYPWGRSLKEYKDMFLLSDSDLKKNILGCADGPASFNYELSLQGGIVTSCDMMYKFTSDEIKNRVDNVSDIITNGVLENQLLFDWNYLFKNPLDLKKYRLDIMEKFLLHYKSFENNKSPYVYAELPTLSFEDNEFDIALVSHLLFLYDNVLSEEFHLKSIIELLRVAKEVRIFPIVSNFKNQSHFLPKILKYFRDLGIKVNLINSNYYFIKSSNQMLVLRK